MKDFIQGNAAVDIKGAFFEAASCYRSSEGKTTELWREIDKKYSEPSRHYHTLTHLNNLLAELSKVKYEFKDWSMIIFAIVYHDIIYKATRKDNEEKSAELAHKRLSEISFPLPSISRCIELILATKSHESRDDETNLFTDADLSILGGDPESYRKYSNQVRREYSIYPDLLYKPGRKKVLQHFLQMPQIFKTSYFGERFEKQARFNLQEELGSL